MEIDGLKGAGFNFEVTQKNKGTDDGELKKACQDFEALYISFIFKSMRKTVPEGGLIKKGAGENIYRQMLDMEVSSELSKGNKFGLSDALYRQLKDQIDNKY